LSFAAYRKVCGWGNGRVLILCLMTLLSVFSYLSIVANTGAFADKYRQVTVEAMESPRNVAQRINYWKFYVREVFGNIKSTAFGHAEPPDRMRYPSAHNYYLDFAYNFGIVALLPLLGLITFTVLSVYENRGRLALSPPLFGLASVVLFLILVENFFKVGMRQPYPGILTFFLWGVLLAELSRRSMHTGKASPA